VLSPAATALFSGSGSRVTAGAVTAGITAAFLGRAQRVAKQLSNISGTVTVVSLKGTPAPENMGALITSVFTGGSAVVNSTLAASVVHGLLRGTAVQANTGGIVTPVNYGGQLVIVPRQGD